MNLGHITRKLPAAALPPLKADRTIPSSNNWPCEDGNLELSECFIWPAPCWHNDDERNALFIALRQKVESIGPIWERAVVLGHQVARLRGTLPEFERHANSQTASLQDYIDQLGSRMTARDRRPNDSLERDLARMREYQLALMLFDTQLYALKDALRELESFTRNNGLKEDINLPRHGTQPVPIADGGPSMGLYSIIFMHNLVQALRLFLVVKQESDHMEMYKRSLPNHRWVITDSFDRARGIRAELAQGPDFNPL